MSFRDTHYIYPLISKENYIKLLENEYDIRKVFDYWDCEFTDNITVKIDEKYRDVTHFAFPHANAIHVSSPVINSLYNRINGKDLESSRETVSFTVECYNHHKTKLIYYGLSNGNLLMIYNPYKANLIRNTPRVFYRIHNIEETSNLLNITISSIETIVTEESYVNFNKDLSGFGY